MADDLNIPQLVENQARPDITTNDATGALAQALANKLACDLSAGNVSITSGQFRRAVLFYATGVATSGRTLTVPQVEREMFLVECNSTNTNTVALTRGATVVALTPGRVYLCRTDGTADGLAAKDIGGVDAPNDFAVFIPGVLSNNQIMVRIKATRAFTLPTNLAGSYVNLGTAVTASTTITFKKNGASIGTSVIASGVDGVHTVTQTAFAIGDLLSVHGPASADVTAADWAVGIKASR